MKWQIVPPNQEGWFWKLDHGNMEIVRVRRERCYGNQLCCLHGAQFGPVEHSINAQWAGPIPTPPQESGISYEQVEIEALKAKLTLADATQNNYSREIRDLERECAKEKTRGDLAIQALREVCRCPTCEGTGIFHPECYACCAGEPERCTCAEAEPEKCPECNGEKLIFLENPKVALIGKGAK